MSPLDWAGYILIGTLGITLALLGIKIGIKIIEYAKLRMDD